MQPKETFTIKELAELFEISRQAISKHVNKLDSSLLAKNERGYKVVLRSGVLQLARNLDNFTLLNKLQDKELYSSTNTYNDSSNSHNFSLLDQLLDENHFLREQLLLKEQNTQHMQKLLDQQQQLTLQANQQIEQLQHQVQRLQDPSDDSPSEAKEDPQETPVTPHLKPGFLASFFGRRNK